MRKAWKGRSRWPSNVSVALLCACASPATAPQHPGAQQPGRNQTAAPTTSVTDAAPLCQPDLQLSAVGTPKLLKLDGAVDEWRFTPDLSTSACSVQVRVARAADGLYLVGRAYYQSPPPLLDKLEAQLSFGFPSLAFGAPSFGSQWGPVEIEKPEDCQDEDRFMGGISPLQISECEQWLEAARAWQKSMRPSLMGSFTIRPKVENLPDGYSFEARIEAARLPKISSYPSDEIWLQVRLREMAGGDARELNVSGPPSTSPNGSAEACAYCPSPFTGRQRLSWAPSSDAASRYLEAVQSQLGDGMMLYPYSLEPEAVDIYAPAIRGYQYTPSEPFPDHYVVRFSEAVEHARLGDIRVVGFQSGMSIGSMVPYHLFTLRGDQVVDVVEVQNFELVRSLQRDVAGKMELHLLSSAETSRTWLGTGMCGACPALRVALVVVNEAGRFQVTGLFGDLTSELSIELQAMPDLSSIDVRLEELDPDSSENLVRTVTHSATYNPATNRYEESSHEGPWQKQ